MSKLDLCLERLGDAEFAEHIWTDRLSIPQVVDRIGISAGLALDLDDQRELRSTRTAWTPA